MIALIITIIILGLLLVAGGWIAYGITLRLLNERNLDRERYKKALELEQARGGELLELVHKEYQSQLDAVKEKGDQAFAMGKNEGKRDVMDWIKTNVDAGSITVKVIGTTIPIKSDEAPAPVAPPVQ